MKSQKKLSKKFGSMEKKLLSLHPKTDGRRKRFNGCHVESFEFL
jgi:hypothetical protein